jgi:hypothetical protein
MSPPLVLGLMPLMIQYNIHISCSSSGGCAALAVTSSSDELAAARSLLSAVLWAAAAAVVLDAPAIFRDRLETPMPSGCNSQRPHSCSTALKH